MSTAALKLYGGAEKRRRGGGSVEEGEGGGEREAKDPNVKSLQMRFLAVFWLLRMADWLQVREKRERER
jgi:hypothetical protein